MEQDNRIGRVEDYTNAFLTTAGAILFMGFFTIGAVFGMAGVLISAMMVDLAIRCLPRLRHSRI